MVNRRDGQEEEMLRLGSGIGITWYELNLNSDDDQEAFYGTVPIRAANFKFLASRRAIEFILAQQHVWRLLPAAERSFLQYVLPEYLISHLYPTHQPKHTLASIRCLHCFAMEPLAPGISTRVASDRASYTADDVLDLLQDVEMNIRERDRHFAAAVSPRQIQCSTAPVAHIDDMRHPRIRLPHHASRDPIPPITGSREEWPPRFSGMPRAKSTGDLERPRVRLPRLDARFQVLPVTNKSEPGLSSPISRTERMYVRNSSALPRDQPILDPLEAKVVLTGNEANDLDTPEMRYEGKISELATCEKEDGANTASIPDADNMDIDQRPSSAPPRYKTVVAPSKTSNKRPRAADFWVDDDDERQKHARKRAKLITRTPAPTTPIRGRNVNDYYSEPPRQSSLLDWTNFEMSASSPIPMFCHAKVESETTGIHDLWYGDSPMLPSDDMDVDPPKTPTATRQITKLDMVCEDINGLASIRMTKGTNQSLPAGDQRLHSSPPMPRLRRDMATVFKLPTRPIGFSDLPDDLQDRIFTILLKSEDEITLSISWLMPFVNSIAGAPTVLQLNSPQPSTLKPASTLRSDLKRIKATLQAIAPSQWPPNCPNPQTTTLTLSILKVSKPFHKRASRLFYSLNIFDFPHQKTCWPHLEAFLATIGPCNAAHIAQIRLRAPAWHLGVRRDALAGALFDSMSPVTRLATFSVPADDRLLSAVDSCARVLGGPAGGLERLRLDVVGKEDVLLFVDRHNNSSSNSSSHNDRYPILPDEAAHHEQRRDAGCKIFRRWSREGFRGVGERPRLVVALAGHHKRDLTLEGGRFGRVMFASLVREAGRYGWAVEMG